METPGGSPGEEPGGSPRLRRAEQAADQLEPAGLPLISPKAQVWAIMSTVMAAVVGTLTVAGTNPRPQQEPGNTTSTSTSPVSFSFTWKVGLFPIGFHPTHSSPPAPR